jgi:hypothetical protein
MGYIYNYDFRNTLAFVTDPGDGADLVHQFYDYPRFSVQGPQFGWVVEPTSSVDGDSAYPPQLAGCNYQLNNGTQAEFRADFGPTGYAVRIGLALGLAGNFSTVQHAEVYDNATLIATVDGPSVVGNFLDIGSVDRAHATFVANQNKLIRVKTSGVLRVKIGTTTNLGDATAIANLSLEYILYPVSATIDAAGTTLTVVLSTPITGPITGSTGLTITASGGAATLSSPSITAGVYTATISRAIQTDETVTLGSSSSNITDAFTPATTVPDFSGYPVANDSDQGLVVPDAPTNFTATANDTGGVDFELDQTGTTPDGWTIQADGTPGQDFGSYVQFDVPIADALAGHFTIDSLMLGPEYIFRARAYFTDDDTAHSDWSNTDTATPTRGARRLQIGSSRSGVRFGSTVGSRSGVQL